MSGTKKAIYWDSNVYLAWLLEQSAYAQWLPDIKAIADDNFKDKNVIVTSTITLIEVLSLKLSSDQERMFKGVFDGYQHRLIEVSPPIAERARAYREKFVGDSKQLLVPDAIHLATAIIEGVDEMHTFDDGKSKGYNEDHAKVKTVSLLSLDGSDKVDSLKIVRPYSSHGPSLFSTEALEATVHPSLITAHMSAQTPISP